MDPNGIAKMAGCWEVRELAMKIIDEKIDLPARNV